MEAAERHCQTLRAFSSLSPRLPRFLSFSPPLPLSSEEAQNSTGSTETRAAAAAAPQLYPAASHAAAALGVFSRPLRMSFLFLTSHLTSLPPPTTPSPITFFFKWKHSWFTVFLLVSGVQQHDSDVSFSDSFHHRLLQAVEYSFLWYTVGSCLSVSQSCVYILTPKLLIYPCSLVTINLYSMSVGLFLICI